MLRFSRTRGRYSCMFLAEILPELADQLAALVRQKGAPEIGGPGATSVRRIVVGAGMSFAPRFTTRSPNLKINTVLAMIAWIEPRPKG